MSAHGTPVGGHTTRSVRATVLLAAVVALTGCDTFVVGRVEPALFPAVDAAAAPPLAGRVALELPPPVRGQMLPGPPFCAEGRRHLQLPLGAIVDAALQRQLGAAFSGGAWPAALPLPEASGVEVAVSVTAQRLALDSHLNWVVPIPVPWPLFVLPLASSSNYSARLELDLRLTDALGRVLVQTTVDSGPVVQERGMWTSGSPIALCVKLTHQAAGQAAAQAARVVRETLQADRQRERPL